MTTTNALTNRKARIRADITAADGTDPTTASTFIETKGCSYVELNVAGLTGVEVCKVRPYFLENVDNGGTAVKYVSCGSEITLSLAAGTTCNIAGVNGRPVFIKVTELTAAATVSIDLGAGRVPPGMNV